MELLSNMYDKNSATSRTAVTDWYNYPGNNLIFYGWKLGFIVHMGLLLVFHSVTPSLPHSLTYSYAITYSLTYQDAYCANNRHDHNHSCPNHYNFIILTRGVSACMQSCANHDQLHWCTSIHDLDSLTRR